MNPLSAESSFNIVNGSNYLPVNETHGIIQKIGERLHSDINSNGNNISLINCFTHEGDNKITIDSQKGNILIEEGEMAADVKSTSGSINLKRTALENIDTAGGHVYLFEGSKTELIAVRSTSGSVNLNNSEVKQTIKTGGGPVELMNNAKTASIETQNAAGDVFLNHSQVTGSIKTAGGYVKMFHQSIADSIATEGESGYVFLEHCEVKNTIKTRGGPVELKHEAKVKNDRDSI
ncbi:DUF4097 family beta strand repeat-containing protein [Acerihabitans sp. KWT182]|uniref:DUF4097 family beta strand repeat-containing protein n=1 Tax=Acerihabitans sp. KWT182 TaxID=3157919 RepID=A0AAU7QDJ7_9GAMM